jgi:hypothetical protein
MFWEQYVSHIRQRVEIYPHQQQFSPVDSTRISFLPVEVDA